MAGHDITWPVSLFGPSSISRVWGGWKGGSVKGSSGWNNTGLRKGFAHTAKLVQSKKLFSDTFDIRIPSSL